ncbi:MAG: hypothetical protein ACOYMA_00335 [Bacteroidia bacterium]
MSKIYNIVKEAINKNMQIKLQAAHYYLNSSNINKFSSLLLKKAVAAKQGNVKIIKKIDSFEDYIDMVKANTTSIYEPVLPETKNFRIIAEDNSLSEIDVVSSLLKIKERFIEAGFKCELIKTNKKYGIRCHSNEDYNTDKLYSFASEITRGININLNDLKVGKLKRFKYSLDDNGHQDVIINVGGL